MAPPGLDRNISLLVKRMGFVFDSPLVLGRHATCYANIDVAMDRHRSNNKARNRCSKFLVWIFWGDLIVFFLLLVIQRHRDGKSKQ